MLSLSSCSSSEALKNDFFENKKSDDIQTLWELVDTYDEFINDSYLTYSKTAYGNEAINTLSAYVPVDFDGVVYKEDLINYQLTDNRNYLEGSLSYSYLEVSKHKDFVSQQCQDIKEGMTCLGETEDEYFTYFVDDGKAYMSYGQVVNSYTTYQYEMLFYTNEDDKKVFEFLVKSISSEPVLPGNNVYKTILVEDEGETSYTCLNCDDEDGNVGLKYAYKNFLDGTYVSVLANKNKLYQVKYFDVDKQTYYNAEVELTDITMNYIEVYDESIMLVKMNPERGYYKLNMIPIDGWDRIYEIDGNDYPTNYELIRSNTSTSETMTVHLETRTGEYIYYEYSNFKEVVPNDILDLSRFELESPYDLQFYSSEVEYFSTIAQDLIEEAGMADPFETLLLDYKEYLRLNHIQ
jgi:hypothetical protein